MLQYLSIQGGIGVKKEYNKEILRYIGEIFVVITFMIVSYIVFSQSNLASYASIAADNYKGNIDLQVLYGRDDIQENDTLLDKGTLSVKNPNKHVVKAQVNLKLSKSANLDALNIVVNGKSLNLNDVKSDADYYIIPVEEYQMEAYEDKTYDTTFYGDESKLVAFNYIYDVQESFYN
mgnify:CR=1 FL=1